MAGAPSAPDSAFASASATASVSASTITPRPCDDEYEWNRLISLCIDKDIVDMRRVTDPTSSICGAYLYYGTTVPLNPFTWFVDDTTHLPASVFYLTASAEMENFARRHKMSALSVSDYVGSYGTHVPDSSRLYGTLVPDSSRLTHIIYRYKALLECKPLTHPMICRGDEEKLAQRFMARYHAGYIAEREYCCKRYCGNHMLVSPDKLSNKSSTQVLICSHVYKQRLEPSAVSIYLPESGKYSSFISKKALEPFAAVGRTTIDTVRFYLKTNHS